jgi:putative proteasome-type protease
MIHRLWGEKLRDAFNSIAEPSWSGAQKSSAISEPAKKMGAVPIHRLSPKTVKPSKAKATAAANPATKRPAKKVATKKKA